MSADEQFTKMLKPERLKAIKLLIDDLEFCELETFFGLLDSHLSDEVENIRDDVKNDIGELGDCLKIKIDDEGDNGNKFSTIENSKDVNNCENSHNDIFKYKCHLCDYKTKQKSNLDCHVNYHINIKPFSCCICQFKSFEKRGLKNHVMKIHVSLETSLSHLEEKYPHLYEPSTPIDDWRNHPELTRPANDDQSSRENKQKNAKTGLKSNLKLSCHQCSYKTRDQFNLNRHLNYHFKIKKYACCMCEFKSFDNRDLKIHIEKKHVTGI